MQWQKMSNANVNILALNTKSYVAIWYTVVTIATIMMVTTIITYVKFNANQSVTATTINYY
jgi:hypothetical protein